MVFKHQLPLTHSSSNCRTAAPAFAQVNEQLLEFNFRNGPLRKRFDGLKWSVRRLQAHQLLFSPITHGFEPFITLQIMRIFSKRFC